MSPDIVLRVYRAMGDGVIVIAPRLVMGLTIAAPIAIVARRAKALSPNGAYAATLVGAAVFAGTGVSGSAMLLAYFTSSSLLGRLPARVPIYQQRGNERDEVQVLANGGVPGVVALAALIAPVPMRPVVVSAYAGAVAAAAADTWATELGSRFGRNPRSIASFTPVMPGTSGGVTLAGLAASAAGATIVTLVQAAGEASLGRSLGSRLLPTLAGGLAGSIADSLLGATVQKIQYCPVCKRETELPIHACGATTMHQRGLRWLGNDGVNALGIACGAIASAAFFTALRLKSAATDGD
jgi:uncharacterized protein (TIGR00297 family)